MPWTIDNAIDHCACNRPTEKSIIWNEADYWLLTYCCNWNCKDTTYCSPPTTWNCLGNCFRALVINWNCLLQRFLSENSNTLLLLQHYMGPTHSGLFWFTVDLPGVHLNWTGRYIAFVVHLSRNGLDNRFVLWPCNICCLNNLFLVLSWGYHFLAPYLRTGWAPRVSNHQVLFIF